jgi:hypothetical protein
MTVAAEATRVVGRSDDRGHRGDDPRRGGHDEDAGGQRGGRTQPAEATGPARLGAEPVDDGSGQVPQPDDGRLEPSPQRAEHPARG